MAVQASVSPMEAGLLALVRPWHMTSLRGGLGPQAGHLAGDDRLHDLGRAAVDGLHPGVGVGPRDRVLGYVAVAAEQLQAPVEHLVLHLGCPELGLGRVDRGQLARVQLVGAMVNTWPPGIMK